MAIPIGAPGPLAFIPPPVVPLAANNIVPLILPAAGAAAVAVAAGVPLGAAVAATIGVAIAAELLFPRPTANGSRSQINWAQQNGPPRPSGSPDNVLFQLPQVSNVKVAYSAVTTVKNRISCSTGESLGDTTSTFSGTSGTIFNVVSYRVTNTSPSVSISCGSTNSNPVVITWRLEGVRADGTEVGIDIQSGQVNQTQTQLSGTHEVKRTVTDVLINGSSTGALPSVQSALLNPLPTVTPVPLPQLAPLINPLSLPVPSSTPIPTGDPITQPAAAPGSKPVPLAPAPTPAYIPRYVPWFFPSPSIPAQPEPQADPSGDPAKTPTIRPSTPGTFPEQRPGTPTVPITTDGTVQAPAPIPVPVTDPTSIVPWPGAAPIPGTAPAPQPTPEGIARELGRIERKLEIMNTPGTPGNIVDKIGDISQVVGPLLEALIVSGMGGKYLLDSPCEVNEDGTKKDPIEVPYSGAINMLGLLNNKLDAIADLIQVHKNLKQPNCKVKPPAGEWVTVQFEEFSSENTATS